MKDQQKIRTTACSRFYHNIKFRSQLRFWGKKKLKMVEINSLHMNEVLVTAYKFVLDDCVVII